MQSTFVTHERAVGCHLALLCFRTVFTALQMWSPTLVKSAADQLHFQVHYIHTTYQTLLQFVKKIIIKIILVKKKTNPDYYRYR